MKLFSFVGDTVPDPFMGSGGTLVAAAQCNRKAIGIEINPHYGEIAMQRIAEEGRPRIWEQESCAGTYWNAP